MSRKFNVMMDELYYQNNTFYTFIVKYNGSDNSVFYSTSLNLNKILQLL
jgi:hypothetical protein